MVDFHVCVARKTLIFGELRDGSGFCQCVIGKELCEESEIKRLTREWTTDVVGELKAYRARRDRLTSRTQLELCVKAWRVVEDSPIELENVINKDQSIPQWCRTGTLSSVPSGPAGPQDTLGDLPQVPRLPHNNFTETFP